jgi:hypothetical protein
VLDPIVPGPTTEFVNIVKGMYNEGYKVGYDLFGNPVFSLF